MAYRDANGNITIDEDEANADIKRLQAVADILRSANERLASVQMVGEESKGLIADGIESTASGLRRDIRRLDQDIQEQIARIRRTVRKYQQVDAKLRETIEASGGGFR